jgi:hypothetical protein
MSGIVACWVTATSTWLVINSQDSALGLAVPEVHCAHAATPEGTNSQIQPEDITGQKESESSHHPIEEVRKATSSAG